VRDAEALEQLDRVPAALRARNPAEGIGDVLPRAQMREQRVLLEEVAAAAPLGRQLDPPAGVEPGLAAARDAPAARPQEAGDDPQHARLAGAGRPGQRDALAVAGFERDRQLELAERRLSREREPHPGPPPRRA
jgi:hypothetical protein